MANQIHRNLTQGELHRPERTGSGSPVGQSFSFLEDGQYYQDVDTGSLWRYSAALATWEQLIQYDRSTGRVTNVTTGVAVQATALGKTTTLIVPGDVSSVGARLVTPIREGEDIKLISSANEDFTLHLTVAETTDTGDVTINVQPTKSVYTIPVGSSIVLESGLQGAYDSVDPTKLERKIERTKEATSVGTLALTISGSSSSVSSIGVGNIPQEVELKDGQLLLIESRNGFSQQITVDGDQTLVPPRQTLNVEAFDPLITYVRGFSFVYEPSFKTTTRITQTENSIELQAQQISNLGDFTSTLNVAVTNNSAQIGLLTEAQVGQNVTIAGLEANATAQQATLALLAQAQSGQNSAIASLEANATAQQATLTLLAQAQEGQNSSIASLEANATAQQASLSLLAQVNEDQNLAIAAINATANSQAASISLLTQVTSTHNVQIEDLNTNVIQLIGDVGTLNTELTTQNIAIAALQLNATAQQATLSLLAQAQSGQNSAISALELNATAQQATLNSSVQYNATVGYIQLLAGPAGSEITLQADQINVDGVVTFINDTATTTIDGDKITTGTITASQINVGDLFSESIEVGNVVKSNNYAVGSTGFAIYANGTAEFRNVVVSGEVITGAGSAIDGEYISNINAGTITAGTIDSERIGANTITGAQIYAGNIFGFHITAGAISAEKIQANAITTEKLSANAVTAAKINVADLYATNANINGTLTIDGGKLIAQQGGNYVLIDSDGITGFSGSLGVTTFSLPTDGSAPVFSSGQILESAFFIGISSVLKTSTNALNGDAGVLINNDGIFAGSAGQTTLNANFRVSSADGSLVAQSATISGALIAGAGSNISGLYVSDLNASTITSGTINASVINVTDINASQITVGTIDVARLNVDEILSENATVNGTLNIGTLGEVTFDGGVLDENGLTLDLASYASTGSALKWGTDTAYIYTEVLGSVPFLKSETSGVIELIAGSEKLSVDSTTSKVTIDSDLSVTGNSIIDSIIIQLDNIPTSPSGTPNQVWVDASGFLRLS